MAKATFNTPLHTSLEFLVAEQGDAWIVSNDDTFLFSFERKEDATLAAIHAAHEAGTKGARAEVILRDSRQCLSVIWIYGIDPLPFHGGCVDTTGSLRGEHFAPISCGHPSKINR